MESHLEPNSTADAVAARAANQFEDTVELLGEYLRYPAVSCDPRHHEDVRRLARRIREDLEAVGLHRSRVLELDMALPVVAAEWMEGGPDAPTVLVTGTSICSRWNARTGPPIPTSPCEEADASTPGGRRTTWVAG